MNRVSRDISKAGNNLKPILIFVKQYRLKNIKQKVAVLTYYGFIAIFPLTLFTMTILNLLLPHASWGMHFKESIAHIIPIIGEQFFHNLNYNRSIGLWLFTELALVLIGTTAWISEFRLSLNEVWGIKLPVYTLAQRLKRYLLLLMLLGLSVLTMTLLLYGDLFVFHGSWLSSVCLLASCLINAVWWVLIIRLSLDKKVKLYQLLPGAAAIGVLIQLMSRFGSYILNYELNHLSSLYGSSAIILGLAVWLYILIQMIFIISEINFMKLGKA